MPRSLSRPTRRSIALVGALATAATATALGGLAGSAGAATPAPAGSALTAHLAAADTSFTVGQVSAPLAYSASQSVAYVELKNTSAYLPLAIDQSFYANEFNAAGAQIGTVKSSELGTNVDVAPGHEEYVQLKLNVPGVTRVQVVNPAGLNAGSPGNPLPVTGSTTATPDEYGDYALSGTVTNSAAIAQGARITVIALGAQGQVLDVDRATPDADSIAPGAASSFSASYETVPGEPAPTSFAYLADGTADPANFGFHIPLSGPLVYGKKVTFSPSLTLAGNAAGATVRLLVRSIGGAPRQLGAGVTNSAGVAKITASLPPGVEAWFVFDGNASNFASSTGDIYYPLTPSLSVSGPHKAVKARSRQIFTGSFPGFTGEKAALQQLIGKHWVKVNNGGYGSKFTMHVTAPKKKGRYSYRLSVGTSPFHSAGTSKTFTLTVK